MSLVSYSYSTDSEDDSDNNNKLQDQKFIKSSQVSTKKNSNNNTERKHNKVIIPAFNLNSNDDDYYQKNIKLQSTKNQSSLLDILPVPKCSQCNKFGDSTRKQSKLIPISALKNYQNNQKKCEKEDLTDNNNFLFPLNMNADKVKSSKNKFNLYASTSTNTSSENITSINLSENQYKRLKKDDCNIRNINVADMLEYQKLRICKNSTEDFCKVSQENVEEPSIPSRKKNHITYLAYKAKINEQDLKNQWSLNRMTRQETRAKYGF